MSRPTCMTIDLAALQANLQRVRTLVPQQSIIAMVKANAYGHGIVRVAHALPHADAFGVASLEEGIVLREAGIMQPIVLMEGLFHADELLAAMEYDFTLVIHHELHVTLLEKGNIKHPFNLWLKINTGMNRLGVPPEDVEKIYSRLKRLSHPPKTIGLMTHFAEADSIEGSSTLNQIQLFERLTHSLPGPRSLANSAGILQWPLAHADWVRPGLMLYGASPLPGKTGQDHGLLPVMTFSSRLIAVVSVQKGERVGYGGTWTAPAATRIGIVAAGYGDGYPQYASPHTPVLVNGRICPLVGRVSMDMLTVELGHDSHDQPNDEVILWGKGLPVEQIAEKCHTSAWEMLTRMTPRPKTHTVY